MTTAEDGAAPSRPTTLAGRAWGAPLWLHTLVLAALLAAAAPFLGLGRSFTIDEGAYGTQVRALHRGSWSYDYAGRDVDPEGRWLPLYHPTRAGGEFYAYVKQPAWPVAVLGATRLAGNIAGLYLLGILGALGVAVAAWRLAGEVQPGASRVAFWLAAASPVAINGFTLWAHAPAAALAGVAVLAAVRGARAPHLASVALLLVSVAGLVLLRAEGALLAGAVCIALLLTGDRARPWRQRVALPAAGAAVAGAAMVVNARWRSSVVGAALPVEGFRGEDGSPLSGSGGSLAGWAGGRLEGAWNSLLQGSVDQRGGSVLVAVALALVIFAAWVLRRRRPGWQRDVAVVLAAVVVLYGLRLAAEPSDPVPGLLAAWPAVLLGLGLLTKQHLRAATPVALVAVLFGAAVLATQYRYGGGREWGGRFFLPAAVPLAVLAALGLRAALGTAEEARRALAAVAVALALLPTVTGLQMLRESRHTTDALLDEVTAGQPALLVTHVRSLPPFDWRSYPEVGWLAVREDELAEAARRLDQIGVQEWTLLAPRRFQVSELPGYRADVVTGPEVGSRGWQLVRLSPA